jgi:hypothetical protein
MFEMLITHFFQMNGTARPSIALKNLQEADQLDKPEREEAEEVIAGALGSVYSGR